MIAENQCEQLSTKTCETVYRVNGQTVRLWIITGGTPALDFSDYGFTKRYPEIERWNNTHWIGKRYDHQDPQNIEGPTAAEVLPNGEQDLIDFVTEFAPIREKRLDRYNSLPTHNHTSPRFHDQNNGCYFRASLSFRPHYVGGVTVDSSCYCGPGREEIEQFGNKAWHNLAVILDQVNTARYDSPRSGGWESLSDEEFDKVVQAIKAVM